MPEVLKPTPTDKIRALIYYFQDNRDDSQKTFCFDQYDLSKVLCELREKPEYKFIIREFLFDKEDPIPTSRLLSKIYANLEVSLISKSNPLLAKKKVIHKDMEVFNNVEAYYSNEHKANEFNKFLKEFRIKLMEIEKAYAACNR